MHPKSEKNIKGKTDGGDIIKVIYDIIISITVIWYIAGIMNWTQDELDSFDQKQENGCLFTMHDIPTVALTDYTYPKEIEAEVYF